MIAIYSDDDYGKGGIACLQNELKSANLSSHVCLASVIPVSNSATSKEYDGIVDKLD